METRRSPESAKDCLLLSLMKISAARRLTSPNPPMLGEYLQTGKFRAGKFQAVSQRGGNLLGIRSRRGKDDAQRAVQPAFQAHPLAPQCKSVRASASQCRSKPTAGAQNAKIRNPMAKRGANPRVDARLHPLLQDSQGFLGVGQDVNRLNMQALTLAKQTKK